MAHSKHLTNTVQTWHPQAQSDTSPPCVKSQLYFLEDTVTPILQTDASDYGVGGYLYTVTNGKVHVIRFFSKALVGAQLNWSAREKECYGIYFEVKTFVDNRHFIMKTDHMNLTYLNVTLTGKVLRWKLYLQDKDFHLCHVPGKEVHQQIPDAFSRLCENNMPSKHVNPVGKLSSLQLEVGSLPYSNSSAEQLLPPQPGVAQPAVVQPKNRIAKPIYKKIAKVHNSMEGHWGLDICKRRLNDPSISDRTIRE